MVYAVPVILTSVFISWYIRLMFKVHSFFQLAKFMSKCQQKGNQILF